MISQISVILALVSAINAAPLPALITRYHTAPAVTTTQTYTTGTTTVWLPPVEVLISDGDTYTFTMTNEEWGTTASTRTSIINKGAEPANTPAPEAQTTPETTQAQTTQAQTTPAQTSQAQTTQAPAPQNTPQTSSTQAPAPQPTTSSTQAPAPSSPAAAPQPSNAPIISVSVGPSPDTSANQPQPTFSQPNQQTTTTTSSTSASSSQPQQPSGTADAGTVSPPSSIVYSPYADNGGCKDQSTIDSDLQMIFNKGIRKVRIYGGDCNLYTATLPKCAQLGIKVNQGLYFQWGQGADSIDQDVSNLIDYGKSNGWGVFDFITVGNEVINDKVLSVQQLLSKISSVKSQLRSNGYQGDVTTSEPPVSFTSHPELCDSSSPIDNIVGINPHSYFDADVDASQAGSFVAGQKSLVEGVCGSKQVVITETGYPSKGNTNGKNVPSIPNQETAIKSIIDATGGDVTILTTYNDFWKSPGPYGIEQYFGTITLFQ